jgi:Family of unknown function (DUF6174)
MTIERFAREGSVMIFRQKVVGCRHKWAVSLLATLIAASASSPLALALTQAELDTQRTLWDSFHLTNFDYDFSEDCLCVVTGLSRVSVRSGVVVTGVPYDPFYVNHGIDVSSPGFYLSVNDLFDELQGAVTHNAFLLDVQFDPSLGYPSSIEVFLDQQIRDSHESFAASNLIAVPEPSAAALVMIAMATLALIAHPAMIRRAGYRSARRCFKP